MIVTIYLDPDNPEGSTREMLQEYEYGNRPIFGGCVQRATAQ